MVRPSYPSWVFRNVTDSQSFVLTGTRGGPTRSRILGALEGEAHTVEELATTLGDSPGTLREHLAVLEANGMVDAHKRPGDAEFVLADEASALPR